MKLQGASALRSRLKAIRGVFKPIGRDWADETVRLARSRVTVRTGKTLRSIRRRNASQKRAAVVATFGARFIEGGTKEHDITPRKMTALKFNVGGRTIFSKKVHKRATPAQPFLHRSARDALAEREMLADLIKLWNEAS